MEKKVEGSMASRAVYNGKITRVSKLHDPERVEFTIESQSTDLNGVLFTIGETVTFEVVLHGASMGLLATLDNMRPTDRVVVACEKVNNQWMVKQVEHEPKRGRMFGEHLNDLETEVIRNKWKK